MILKGNQRGGGRQMALHLLNGEQNEHVTVHQVRGFIAEDVLGALNEAYAISKGTQCRKYMYSLSLNPPQTEEIEAGVFDKTLERIEKKLGLDGQPRVVVFHEKEGRRHAHCVWSRIDIDNMKAINIAHDRLKLNSIAKSLYLENGWTMPEGFKGKNKSNPLNFTRAEWEQAKRIGRKASDIKAELQECWAVSDIKKGFEAALKEDGYFLAKGDKRSYIVMDLHGEIYSLPRQLGLKKTDLEGRLGKSENLSDIKQTKIKIAKSLSPLYLKYREELTAHHKTQSAKLIKEKISMRANHRKIREDLKAFQDKRWQQEENQRAARVRHGFKGLWDKLSGRYWKIRKQNEQEAYTTYSRDQKQKEELIAKHLTQRQELQTHIKQLHKTQEAEHKDLLKDFSHIKLQEEITTRKTATNELDQSLDQDYDAPELDI